jgi:hypothetical protein
MTTIRLAARLTAALAALTLLAGCFETRGEVFKPDAAVAIPGLEGIYVTSTNRYAVAAVPGSSDYAFTNPTNPKDGPGRFRAVPVGADLYAVQLRLDEWDADLYWQLLFRVIRKGDAIERIVALDPDLRPTEALAAKSGIELLKSPSDSADDPKILTGAPEAVANFVKALATLPAKEGEVYRRVR